ncbi:MAG: hypothetical protein M3O02_05170 [Acidobacteriota bacterium]|nr:hypothetical protein [Acidobacteriota bacterium]
MEPLPTHGEQIAAFIAAFEDGTLPKARWTHGAHILTGAWYVHGLGREAAIGRMREAVRRYNLAVGGKNTAAGGYHETITVFWIKLLAALQQGMEPMERHAFASVAVERFGDARRLHEAFYTFDVMASEQARREWMEPERPLDTANL